MTEVDLDKALSLIRKSDSITYGDELIRRINAYNKLRVRDMDYILDTIRYEGLSNSSYLLFSRELSSLPSIDEIN